MPSSDYGYHTYPFSVTAIKTPQCIAATMSPPDDQDQLYLPVCYLITLFTCLLVSGVQRDIVVSVSLSFVGITLHSLVEVAHSENQNPKFYRA